MATAPATAATGPAERIDMSDLATYPLAQLILSAQHDAAGVTVRWDDGRQGRFHALWLRDNCACPACRHPQALERMFLLVDAAGPVRLTAARVIPGGHLEVELAPDTAGAPPHLSRFDAGWLRRHCYADWARAERRWQPQPWGEAPQESLRVVDHRAVMESEAGLAEWLRTMRDRGVVLLRGAPAVPGEIRRIAERVAPMRPTNFGTVYDVISMPNPNASAYTPIGLEPHTDLANWRWPPDYQLLFCVANDSVGGESILVDGYAAAEALHAADPGAFQLLTQHPLEFRFHDDTCDIRNAAPVIALDPEGRVERIRFNNWLRAALDVPEAAVEPFYGALVAFWRLLRDPRFRIRLKLAAGEMVAFDNARVLHGREPFDPMTGRRHLQGGYLDRDLVLSRLRLIERASA